jgi:hypothetical protein
MAEDFTDADAKALCASLDVDTEIVQIDGQPRVVINEAGMRKLADHAPIGAAAAHAMVDEALATMRAQRHGPLARVRTEIVDLIVASTRRPLNGAEQDIVAAATLAERQAASHQVVRSLGEDGTHLAALNRMRELLAPHFAILPAGSVMGDAMALMGDAERTELTSIARTLPIDGTVIVDPED